MLQGQQNSIIYPGSVQPAPFGTTPTGYGYGSFTAVYNGGTPTLTATTEQPLAINGNLGAGNIDSFNFHGPSFFSLKFEEPSLIKQNV